MSTPLIERLRAGLSSPPCNADGTYTVGNCSPDVLMFEAAAEIERLRADAARYQWLRDTECSIDVFGNACALTMDSAIDAAMRDAPNARLSGAGTASA